MRLPKSVLSSSTSAVIVPIFFLSPAKILSNCTTLLDCAKLCCIVCMLIE